MTFPPNRAAAALVLIVTFAVFAPSLGHEFLNWDDDHLVVENAGIRQLNPEGVTVLFTSYCVGNYTPLERLSLALDFRLWGMEPWGFHFTNNLLHALNTALFFILALRIFTCAFGTERSPAAIRWSAAIAALAFALHPLRVESVVWISERRDVLALFFLLLCVLCHWESVVSDNPGKRSLCRMGAWMLFLASLLSKASGVTLPVVLLLLDFYPLSRFGFSSMKGGRGENEPSAPRGVTRPTFGLFCCVREKIPFFVLSLIFGLIAIRGQTGRGTMLSLDVYPWASRLANSFAAVVFYVEKWILPFHLDPIYPPAPHNASLVAWPWIGCAAWVVLVTWFVTWRARKHPAPAVAWWSYLVMILPFTGVLQAGTQGAADRYTLLATIPFALVLGAAVRNAGQVTPPGASTVEPDDTSKPGKPASNTAPTPRGVTWPATIPPAPAVFILLLVWTGLTFQQMSYWKDSLTFWECVLTHNPHGFNPLNSNGAALMADGRPCQARVMFREVTRWNPRWSVGWQNLGMADARTRREDQAVAMFEKALALDVGMGAICGDAHFALADIAMKRQRFDAARRHLFMAVQDGYTAERLRNLGLALEGTGQTRLALKYVARAAQQGDVMAFVMGVGILERHGRYAEALSWLEHGYGQTRDRQLLDPQPAMRRKIGEAERKLRP